ncbi:MAG: DMT family transporter [Chloroflexi bacterium]|nr:DMT family transporter [Chloroflexota bacterium]
MTKTSPLTGILAGLTAAAIWGGMYVVSKAVMDVIPPFSLITLRLLLGIVTLWLVAAVRGRLHVARRHFWQIFWVGFVGYGISIGFQFVGTNLSTAANGALVTSATPAFVLLFAALLLGEKITPRRFLALLVASLGVLAVIDPRKAQLSSSLFLGNLNLVAAALTWALYSVLIRKITRGADVLTVSLIAFIGGLPVSIPMGAWEVASQGIGAITPGVIGGVLFLGIIATALAMYLWNMAFATLDAGIASLTFFAQPVVGTILGAIFLNEQITPLFVLGGVLIGLGLIISSFEK